MGLLAADGVHGLVVHQRQEPRPERAAGAVVGPGVAPVGEEGLLDDVLGQLVVADDPAGQAPARAVYSSSSSLKDVPAAVLDRSTVWVTTV